MSTAKHGHGQPSEGASPESVKIGFELTDWQVRPVIVVVTVVLGTLMLGFLVISALFFTTGRQISDSSHRLVSTDTAQAQLPPVPRLEQNPNVDGTQLINEAKQQLERYSWVNKGQGLATIPVERAKALLLEKGIRPFATTAPPSATPTP